jgi:lipoprotein-anchoring transpeptidase ErfK/SrfK
MQTSDPQITLHVSIPRQEMTVCDAAGTILRRYPVSTSRFGIGTEPGSFRTPVGEFRICEKIGDGALPGTVFKARVPTGQLGAGSGDEDLVLTRILWLEGAEEANANTRDRYIYIHGTNHEALLGQPASHGCVRMSNVEVAELYELVAVGCRVCIEAAPDECLPDEST